MGRLKNSKIHRASHDADADVNVYLAALVVVMILNVISNLLISRAGL